MAAREITPEEHARIEALQDHCIDEVEAAIASSDAARHARAAEVLEGALPQIEAYYDALIDANPELGRDDELLDGILRLRGYLAELRDTATGRGLPS